MKCFSPAKWNTVIRSTTWMNLKNIMLNERRQKQKGMPTVIP